MFKFICSPHVISGCGSIQQLPEEIKRLNGSRACIIMDRALSKLGLKDEIETILSKADLKFAVYDKIAGEPTTDTGNEAAAFAKTQSCDIIVGIGGGSSLDTAKAVAVLVTNGKTVEDYQGLDKVPKPGLPKIMVPTTAGTGSEVTFTAVFIRKAEKKKAGINSQYLYPESAILDAQLTLSLPPGATASTGMDAFCHAIESFLSRRGTFLSRAISEKALGLIWENLPMAYRNPGNVAARKHMLNASFLAGLGLANAGVIAVHSLSYPLGGLYGIPHGTGNAVLLPYVLESALPEAEGPLAYIGGNLLRRHVSAKEFIAELFRFESALGIPRTLTDIGIPAGAVSELADGALQVKVPLDNHPKALSREQVMQIYESAF